MESILTLFLSEFAAGILNRGVNPRNGRKTDNAHPPIHPTKYTNTLQVRFQIYFISNEFNSIFFVHQEFTTPFVPEGPCRCFGLLKEKFTFLLTEKLTAMYGVAGCCIT